jgi:2-C-methyl-D-erythritol 4-phosphate cytidylyltransferase
MWSGFCRPNNRFCKRAAAMNEPMNSNNSSDMIWALIPAAGKSSRLSGGLPKQYRLIDGRPVLLHTLQRLAKHPQISGFTVCLAADDPCWASMPAAELNKPLSTCEGGASRAASVLCGLKSMHNASEDQGYVLVHDAVRPCFALSSIDDLIKHGCQDEHGAMCALPVSDSLKLVNDVNTDRVLRTVNRKNIWLAQTPQLYRASILMRALEQALKVNPDVYDEAEAMEIAGYHPHLVHGSPANFKLTFDDDLRIARRLLETSA